MLISRDTESGRRIGTIVINKLNSSIISNNEKCFENRIEFYRMFGLMLDFEIISIKRSENSPLKRCYMDYNIVLRRFWTSLVPEKNHCTQQE